MPMHEIPAIAKVLAVFAFIVTLNRLRLDLGLSIMAGSVILGLSFGLTIVRTISIMAGSLAEPLTVLILLLVLLILFLNQLMEKNGSSKAMVLHFTRLVRSFRVSMVALPALIGLLPMPGGAYFSAPMVEQLTNGTNLTPSDKTVSNYWFRHLWEFWWPMYPGVILALTLSGLPLSVYIGRQFVYTLFSLLAGWFFLLRRFQGPAHQTGQPQTGNLRPFVYNALPILIILASLAVFSPLQPLAGHLFPSQSGLSKYFPMFAGMIISVLFVVVKDHYRPAPLLRVLATRKIITLMLMVAAIMAYKKLLMECGAIHRINDEFRAYNIPLLPVVMLLPMLSGLVLAVAMGFVGASFPVVISLTQDSPDFAAWISLAYVSGYTGMMLSPIHMCLVLTKDYFKGANWAGIYKLLLPPAVSVLFFGMAVFYFMTR